MPRSLQLVWRSSKLHKKYINAKDQAPLLNKVSNSQYLYKIAECMGWKKLWDHALDDGTSVIKGMKNLMKVITTSR